MRGVTRPVFNRAVFVDIKQQLKLLIPEPDQNIVNRLISYYKGTNYSIRLPWETTPTQSYYDLEEVKNFARVLQVLKNLNVFPPVITKSMGGGKLPNIIPGNFDGPTQITPSGNASGRCWISGRWIRINESSSFFIF